MANEASKRVRIDLGKNGGAWTFNSWEEIERFIQDELDTWSWLAQPEHRDPANASGTVWARLNQLKNEAATAKGQNAPFETWAPTIQSYYVEAPNGILHRDGEIAERINIIRNEIGPKEAAFAYGFHKTMLSFQHVHNTSQHAAILYLTAPWIIGADKISKRLSAERTNLRNLARSEANRLREFEEEREAQWEQMLSDAEKAMSRWVRKRLRRWVEGSKAAKSSGEDAVKSIRDVEKAFREQMRLKAPVEYWEKKATLHQAAEDKATRRLLWFFPIALVGLIAAFAGASYLILHPGVETVPTPIYVIVSAGLASIAGVVFWIGRLLTRLYLSEHHLRKDADERAIMTTTYLALLAEQAASDADRQIILAALFRNSADGIVRDDGAGDLTLANLLARTGIPSR